MQDPQLLRECLQDLSYFLNFTIVKTTIASSENYHHYNRKYKHRARELRNRMTKAEKKLWQMIRKRSIHNCLFTRQRPVLEFIADFMCKELLLIVEADGISHDTDERAEKDKIRDRKLKNIGFTILRFKDSEILTNPFEVYSDIKLWIEERLSLQKENLY